MLLLSGTTSCYMRDELAKAVGGHQLTCKQVTERLYNTKLPDWLQSQILQMVNYRRYERCTDRIEQAMEAAIHRKIIAELIKQTSPVS